jgi:hypothetical protein
MAQDLYDYEILLKTKGFTTIGHSVEAKNGDSFCEALNYNGRWSKISIWYDGSGTSYPEETWNMFADKVNSMNWKAMRMVKIENNKKVVLKIEIDKEKNEL